MRRLRLILAGFVFIVGLLVLLFPLELADQLSRLELRLHGVEEVRIDGLHGFVADHCDKTGGEKSDCSCVALIHGLGDRALTWKSLLLRPSSAWKKPLRFYALDLPGTEGSEPPLELSGYRVRSQAEKLKHALAPLCPTWTIVGNSLGGWISAWTAMNWKEGVSRLMLVDSAGINGGVNPAKIRSYFVEPTPDSMTDFLNSLYARPPKAPHYLREKFAQRIRASNTKAIVEAQVADDWLGENLGQLKIPTLLFWGETDGVTSISSGKKMASLIVGSLWREVPDCGHLPQRECPAYVVDAINELLSQHSGPK